MTRFILNATPENMMLAMRAARWLLAQPPEQKDAILTYGERVNESVFYVRRNRSSISVFENKQGE